MHFVVFAVFANLPSTIITCEMSFSLENIMISNQNLEIWNENRIEYSGEKVSTVLNILF